MSARGTMVPATVARRPRLLLSAPRTSKSVRPSQLREVSSAGFVGGEPSLEFREILREILHGAERYMLGSLESSK